MAFSQTGINWLHYGSQSNPSGGLVLLETLYALGVQTRMWAYQADVLKTHRLNIPVISVGNLTTGGTGKTPIVIALAHELENRGQRVAVLSRGYQSRIKTDFHEAIHPDYGDEPYMIQQQLTTGKVFVGRDRVYTGLKALEQFQPDIVLLDDGFQHIRLHRDLNILLVDGENHFGNNHLLPAGPLREPISAMVRADWILITKNATPFQAANLKKQLTEAHPEHPIQIAACPFEPVGLLHPESNQIQPLNHLASHPVWMMSGIAQPGMFERYVRNHLDNPIVTHTIFSDHHHYSLHDLKPLERFLREDPTAFLLTTEKDWVKIKFILPSELQAQVYLLRIEPIFDWEPLLDSVLSQRILAHG